MQTSGLEETAPWGHTEQAPFVNAIAEIQTSLGPEELLSRLKEGERKLGRQERFRWGPREIDLDILFFGDTVHQSETLMIPHPELASRSFVLKQLVELDKELIHPVLQKTVSDLLQDATSRL